MTAFHPTVAAFLSSPPARGGGLNVWILAAAHRLRHYGQPSECIAELRSILAGHAVKPGEIERAVAKACNSTPLEPVPPAPKRNKEAETRAILKYAADTTAHIAAEYSPAEGLEILFDLSPESSDTRRCEGWIDTLFPGNPLLCVGHDNSRFQTAPREELRGTLESMALIVPNPMSALTGRTQDGKVSAHTLANTGPRRYFVVDQDAGSIAHQVQVILYLRQFAPLVMVLHSGGKSLHAWFNTERNGPAAADSFMRLAVSLGADKSLTTRSQFVRMPDGTRQTGEHQTVHYFDSALAI